MGFNTSLNQQYSFERFIVGTSNRFAHTAAVEVSKKPVKNYNPLLIYGGVGLGKTHLLNAIGLGIMHLHPLWNILYLSAAAFMNELGNAIRGDKMPKFREKFMHIDCLLIDDIQFIAGEERTQEELYTILKILRGSDKQIVVTSDIFTYDIPNLRKNLHLRSNWELIADIQPPEIETKLAIVEKKAHENNIDLSHNAALYIASCAGENIRELEGYLAWVAASLEFSKDL